MIVLRLPDGALLVVLPDGQAVRVGRDGATPPLRGQTGLPSDEVGKPLRRCK